MKIQIISIVKRDDKLYRELIDEFRKMSQRFAKIENLNLFSKELTQNRSESEIKSLYTKLLTPYVDNSRLNIAFDVEGEKLDSFKFSNLFNLNQNLNIFIGGAFGFEREFLKSCDRVLSLSELTMSHKVAKLVIFEQVFRALTILNNHPYHK